MSFIALMEGNLFTTKEFIFAVIFLGGSLIFYGKNVVTGLLISFATSAVLFIVYYLMGWQYEVILKIMLLFFALMAIMIFMVKKQTSSQGVF